jgi:ArsR family transcriptional regulator, arsenate/arsenite/antimonite-responsive transcriptional repressor
MNSQHAVAALAALAQETRLRIYRLLVEAGPTGLAVGEIGASVKVAPATLSFHLKELFHAGLVAMRQEGRFIYYSANYDRMNRLLGYLTENCCASDGVTCARACRAARGTSKTSKE